MFATYLCHELFEHPDDYLIHVKPRVHELQWVGRWLQNAAQDNYGGGPTLRVIAAYVKKYDKMPDRKGVQDYANDVESRGKNSGFRDLVESDIADIAAKVEAAEGQYTTDIHVLIEMTIEEGRKMWGNTIGHSFAARCMGVGQEDKPTGKPQTVDDAIVNLRKNLADDLPKYAPVPEGALDENTEHVASEIERLMSSGMSDRIPTGLPHIDDNLVISKRQRRFIVIMGFANDGKTTLLNTLLYNMALNGKSVILFTREHDPLEVWMSFAFLHSHHSDYRNDSLLPPMSKFEKCQATDENKALLLRILEDIRTRRNLPGRIEVRRLTTWESLADHLKTNQAKNKYDVCAADYLARIDIPAGKPQFRNQDLASYIGYAQALTRDFDGGKGIVFITPAQINRSGYQQAKKKKEGEKKHDLTSISQHSRLYEDADLVLSLWRDGRYENDILLEVQKVRGAAKPPDKVLRIDSCSRRVTTQEDAVVDEHWQQFLQGKEQSPTTRWFREHFIQHQEGDDIYSTL